MNYEGRINLQFVHLAHHHIMDISHKLHSFNMKRTKNSKKHKYKVDIIRPKEKREHEK